MAATGDTLTLPGGTSFTVVESTADSDGRRVEFEIAMPAGAMGPPKHFHPRQEESWRVVEGELSVLVHRTWHTLGEGESMSIRPNVVHTLRNRSDAVVRFRDIHEPALDFQEYIEALAALTATEKLTRRSPAALIHLAMVLRGHRTTQLTASGGQRAAETVLAGVGRLLGYRVG
jgi:mannose-6-phosphate isomerase-like protein (cupin superfamily)